MAGTLVNGVASGDTTQTSTVLWTRSTTPGRVLFEYATDAGFKSIFGKARRQVSDPAIPVKVQIKGLEPATQYYYRATDPTGQATVGRFRTPAPQRFYQGLRFGVSGDWQGELSPYASISNADERNLDFFMQVGDTLEADSESPALPGVTQAKTLEQFRIKHAEIYSDRFGRNFWADLRASTPTYATWDDHEITNDFAGGATPARSPQKQGIFGTATEGFVNDTPVFDAALRAFQDYKPLRDEFYGNTADPRTSNEQKLYRFNQFGRDAASFVLDVRSFRDAPLPFLAETASPDAVNQYLQNAFQPGRTMLGAAQLQQFKADLLAAQKAGTTWKFVMSSVPIQNFGIPTLGERWEGFAAERADLLRFIQQNNIENVVFVTGDFHGNVVNNVTYQEGFGQPQIPTGVVDVMTSPVGIQLTVPFLPAPFNQTFAAPFGTATVAFTPPSLLATQGKSQAQYLGLSDRAAKDQFVREVLDTRITALGNDPIGLEGSGINAQLLQGQYIAAHTYGWTEFEINPRTQKLLVTTYGVNPYTQADLQANPDAIAGQQPFIVSQFTIDPVGFNPKQISLLGTDAKDVLSGTGGNDRIKGLRNNDTLDGKAGRDILLGNEGKDTLRGKGGDDRLVGGFGNDSLIGGKGRNIYIGEQGQDTFGIEQGGLAIIQTYQDSRDRLQLLNGLKFSNLEVVQRNDDVAIELNGKTLAVLNNSNAIQITGADFI